VRRFVLVGQTASASGQFSLEDLPSSSGRLDVLLRCLRAALLVSHGLRRDVQVWLVLRGGPEAPRILRVNGENAKFLRPDERSLATLIKKTLSAALGVGTSFRELRPGLEVRAGDLADVLSEATDAPCYWLDEAGADVREHAFVTDDAWFFIGDHLGFDVAAMALLERHGALRISVGPVSLHSDDVVTLLGNELDRRFKASVVV
jgi:tRNA (pseudouridine54-N1)-methyltransferase